jgi:demethylmenaquinone methyltransferase/2-methoxy-6-polyprenyl-1,4-benzoquinol methylase
MDPRDLFEPLPLRYDVLQELLSFGQNARWRRAAVSRIVTARPALVADIASGTAGVAIQVARRTGAEVVGVDLTEPMLRQGRTRVHRAGLQQHIHLTAGRAEQLPFRDASFDALTFTYLLRYVADPAATLTELGRVLRPGAPMASLEFHLPPNPAWRAAWAFYTRAVLPVAGRLTGGRGWQDVGHFLGPNIAEHYRRHPVEHTVEDWKRAGFVDVGYRLMSLGGGLVMWGTRRNG